LVVFAKKVREKCRKAIEDRGIYINFLMVELYNSLSIEQLERNRNEL